MKKIQFLVATILLLTPALVWAAKPDPSPNPPLSVSVENTPDVNVASMPDVDVATLPPVIVANTPPEREPFYEELSEYARPEPGSASMYGDVATGKRMYIEHVSLRTLMDPLKHVVCWVSVREDIDEHTTFNIANHYLALSTAGPPPSGGVIYIASTPISLTAEAGQFVSIRCSSDGSVYVRGHITGYLIDVFPTRID